MANYEFKLTLSGSGETEEEAWADAVDAFCADPGEPEECAQTDKFTVMLLRPDYATDNYGWDTFTETVSALGADEAIAEVKSLCAIADGRNLEINTYEYVQDLHVLAVMKGDVEFIQ